MPVKVPRLLVAPESLEDMQAAVVAAIEDAMDEVGELVVDDIDRHEQLIDIGTAAVDAVARLRKYYPREG